MKDIGWKIESINYSPKENKRCSRSIWATKAEIEFLQFVFEKIKSGSGSIAWLLYEFWNDREDIVTCKDAFWEDQSALFKRLEKYCQAHPWNPRKY